MSNSVGMASFRRFFLRLKVPLSAWFMNWSAVKWFSHKASCVILPRSRFKFRSSRRVLIHHLWHLCTERSEYKEMHLYRIRKSWMKMLNVHYTSNCG